MSRPPLTRCRSAFLLGAAIILLSTAAADALGTDATPTSEQPAAASSSRAERLKWPLRVSIGAGLVLQAVDLKQTISVARAGDGRERNPVLAPLVRRPVLAGVFVFTVATGSAENVRRKHATAPRLALVASLLQNGFYTWVVIHNAHALRAREQRR